MGPLLFNIFLNDLLYSVTKAKLNSYADDNQLYTSNKDPKTLEDVLNYELSNTKKWYEDNHLMANPEKYQSITLAGKEVLITLQVDGQQIANAEEINLLGIDVYIDKKLQFRQHMSNLCKKVSRQLGVSNRLKKLIPQDAEIKLYNSFLLSHLQYCSSNMA